MNQADENDLLGQVREALGADPKEGVVAAARRVKREAADAHCVPYGDQCREKLGAGADEATICAVMRVVGERDAAIAKAKAAEEALAEEVGKRIEADRMLLATNQVASDCLTSRNYFESRAKQDNAIIQGLFDILTTNLPGSPHINEVARRVVEERDAWKARAEKAEANHGSLAVCQAVERELETVRAKLAEEKRKRELYQARIREIETLASLASDSQ